MAGKKSKAGLEGIRTDVRSLTEAVWALRDQVSFNGAAAAGAASSKRTSPDQDITVDRGTVSVQGSVMAGGVTATWQCSVSATDSLSSDDQTVRVLAAMGHRQRLAILATLIDSPSTVADLVANLALGTTGAAYHHLNVLQAAGLVTQVTRGNFTVAPDQAGVIVSILVGSQVAESVSVSCDGL